MRSGYMYWWRAKGSLEYRFGYATNVGGNLFRMGRWNGDTNGGPVVDAYEIEFKSY